MVHCVAAIASSVGLFLICAMSTAAAQTVGPSADYKISAEYTSTSPDGATKVEQYAKISPDGDYTWQFWARHGDQLSLLKPEQPDYAAGFRFTSDSHWLVRMQKTAAGEGTLYLYRLGPQGIRCRDSEAAGRAGVGVLQQPSRFAKDQKAGFSYRCGPLERN